MPKLLNLSSGAVESDAPEAALRLAHDRDLVADPPSLQGVDAIRLELPAFKDGRAFSQARHLRLRLGFEGQIRVGGHVLPDQAFFLYRTGFDAVELDSDERIKAFREALSAYRYAYQHAERGKPAYAIRGNAR